MIGKILYNSAESKADGTLNFDDNKSFKVHSFVLKHYSKLFLDVLSGSSNFSSWWKYKFTGTSQSFITARTMEIILGEWYELGNIYSSKEKYVLQESLTKACKYLQCDLVELNYIPEYKIVKLGYFHAYSDALVVDGINYEGDKEAWAKLAEILEVELN